MKIFCQQCGTELKEGIVICPKCGFENTIAKKKSIFLKIVIIVVTIIFLAVAVGFIFFKKTLISKVESVRSLINGNSENTQVYTCNFEIVDLKEYKGGGDENKIAQLRKKLENTKASDDFWAKYDSNTTERDIWEEQNYRWFYYEGVLKNTSKQQQYLININAKLRTNDNVFIKEGWSERINRWLAPSEGIPFKITVKVDSTDLVKKYVLDKDITLKTDLYPWFNSCTY